MKLFNYTTKFKQSLSYINNNNKLNYFNIFYQNFYCKNLKYFTDIENSNIPKEDSSINFPVNIKTKVYFFGNDIISLPCLKLIYSKLYLKGKREFSEEDNLELNDLQNTEINDIKKKLNDKNTNKTSFKKELKSSLSIENYKKIVNEDVNTNNNAALDVVDLHVITTPWTNNNKMQENFHKFVKEKSIKSINILNNNWDDVIDELNKQIYKNDLDLDNNENTSNSDENKDNEDKNICKNYKSDDNLIKKIGIVLSFGKMIPKNVIDILSSENNLGIYVLHPSLLPNYRGGSPIQHALLNNETKTGVTLIYTNPDSYDTGNIIIQKEVNIEPYYRYIELASKLSNYSAYLLNTFIDNYFEIIKTNNESQISKLKDSSNTNNVSVSKPKIKYAKIIKDKNYLYLDFFNKNTSDILLLYRAFYGSNMHCWSFIKYGINKKLVIFDNLFKANPTNINIINNDIKIKDFINTSGCIYWDFKLDPEFIYIKTADSWIVTNSIKVEGYPFLKSKEFVKTVLKDKKLERSIKKCYANIIDKNTII